MISGYLGVLVLATIMGGTLVTWALASSDGRRLGFAFFSLLHFVVVVVGAWNVRGDVGPNTFLKGTVIILISVFGMFAAAFWSWNDRKVFKRSYPTLVPMRTGQLMVVKLLIVVSITAGLLYYYLSGSVPIVDFLRSLIEGQRADLDALRVRIYVVGSERGEVSYFGQGYLRQFYGSILPWGALVLLLDDKLKRGKLQKFTLVSLVSSVFFALASGQRWPIIYLLLAYTLGLCLFADQGRIVRTLRRPTVVAAGVLSLLLIVAVTIGQGRATTLDIAMRTVFTRIAGTDIRTFFRLVEYVDAMGLRFFGSTWLMDLEAFLPGARPTFSIWVHQALYGTANTAPPTLIGSFYVNFGIIGVFVGSFMATRFASHLDTTVYRRNVISSSDIATIAYAIMHLGTSLHTDFIPKLYGVIFVFVLNITVKFIASFLVALSQKNHTRTVLVQQ